MTFSGLRLWVLLLVWQGVRCAALLGLVASAWQVWLLLGVVAGLMIDLAVLPRIHRLAGLDTGTKSVADVGPRDRWGLATIGFIFYLCATAIAAVIPMVQGTNLNLGQGRRVGPLTIAAAAEQTDAGVVEFAEGSPRLEHLGSVRYQMTRSSKEFYYALPFVTDDWTAAQPVAVWAIVHEREIQDPQMPSWRFGFVVAKSSMHYDAYAKAIAHSRERGKLQEAPQALVVRLAASAPGGVLGSEAGVIGLIFLGTWLLTLPYAILATRQTTTETLAESTATAGAEMKPAQGAATVRREFPGWMRLRRTWLFIHLGLLLAAAAIALTTPFWFAVLFSIASMFLIPLFEGWLVFRTYRDMRSAGRVALLFVVVPLTMVFGIICVVIAAEASKEKRGVTHSAKFSVADDDRLPAAEFLELAENHQVLGDRPGVFYAPNEKAESWWVFPVVSKQWTGETPVRVWLKSTNRRKDQELAQPLKFVQIERRTDARSTLAIRDAVAWHGLTAAPDAIVVERVNDPVTLSNNVETLLVSSGMICLVGWLLCASFWPRPPVY